MMVRRVFFATVAVALVWVLISFTPVGGRLFEMARGGIMHVVRIGRDTHQRLVADTDRGDVDRMVLQATIDVLTIENNQLREMLGFSERFVFSGTGASVIARTFNAAAEELVLDRGEVHGVARGSPVVAADGVLVGVISRVERERSVVRLLIDPASRVAGRLLNTDQTEGVVAGGHGIVVRLELIPRDEHVTEGMVLVTSGLDELIPRGLVIGEVVAVEPDSNSLFLRAIIAPPLDYDRLTNVLIGTSL